MEYVIDNEHFADHLTPPSSTPPVFFNLTQYIDEETLSTLDSYLLSNDILHFAEKQKEWRVGIFPAEGKKHADCIELCDRDTSTWCQDVFRALNGKDDFRQCRGHRGDPKTWRPNTNAFLLPGVESFARKLPFFSQIGKIHYRFTTVTQHGKFWKTQIVAEDQRRKAWNPLRGAWGYQSI